MISKKGKKVVLSRRFSMFGLFVFLPISIGVFFFFISVNKTLAANSIATFQKPVDGTLFSTEWNDLLGYDGNKVYSGANPLGTFVPTFLPALMYGPLGINTAPEGAQLKVRSGVTLNNILGLFNNAGAEVFTVLNSGNVGIGTSNPANKLTIAALDNKDLGPIISLAGTSANQTESGRIRFTEIDINQSPYYQGAFIHYNGSSNALNIGVHNNADDLTSSDVNAISIFRSNANISLAPTTGSVGIGTTTPVAKLHVVGPVNNYTINVGGYRIGNLMNPDLGTDAATRSYVDSAFGALSPLLQGGASSTWIVNGTNIYNVNSGNVGIGTATPAAKLTVTADISVNGMTIGKGGANRNNNIAFGNNALALNTTGDWSTAIGGGTLGKNTTGTYNTAIGGGAMFENLTGQWNLAAGTSALSKNNSGSYNTAVGPSALILNTTGSSNTAIGVSSSYNNLIGTHNISIGRSALFNNTEGNFNTSIGGSALGGNLLGSNNIAIGYRAARYITGTTSYSASNNSIYIGVDTKPFDNNMTNEIVIGYDNKGLGSNTVSLGNDSVVLTALKGSVGIGTTTPAAKLHVVGPVGNYTINAGGYRIGNLMNPDLATDAATRSYVDSAFGAVSPLLQGGASSTWAVNGTNIYNVNSGNVGIGTTSPSALLHLSQNSTYVEGVIENTNSGSSAAGFAFRRPGQSWQLGVNNVNAFRLRDETNSRIVALIESGAPANSFYLNSSGNLGIGTTSPTSSLHINTILNGSQFLKIERSGAANGFFSISNYTSSSGVFAPIFNGKSNTASFPGTTFIGDTTSDTGNVAITQFLSRQNNGVVSTRPLFSFGNFTSGDAYTKMVIMPSGNIGIGTTTPSAILEVISADNHSILAGLKRIGNVADPSLSTDAANRGYVDSAFGALSPLLQGGASSTWVVNGTDIYNVNSGNVGIGTTNPTGKLHFKATGLGYGAGGIRFEQSANTSYWDIMPAHDSLFFGRDGASILQMTSSGLHYGGNQATAAFRLNNSGNSWLNGGNVGIGTTTPTEKLEVIGNLLIDGSGSLKLGGNIGQNIILRTGWNGVADTLFFDYSAGAGSTIMALQGSNGNVGIGTTTPAAKLDVLGQLNLRVTAAQIYGIRMQNRNATQSWVFGTDATVVDDGKFYLAKQGSAPSFSIDPSFNVWLGGASTVLPTMAVQGNGNVGIATTTPGHRLTLGTPASGDYSISAGGYRMGNLLDPSLATDAATRGYVDSAFGTIAPGGSSSAWTLAGNDTYNTNYQTGRVSIGTNVAATLLTLANNGWISAINSAGTGHINMFRVNSSNQIEVGAPLNISQFQFSQDSGYNTFVDMPVSSAAPVGSIQGYTMKVDGENILSVYSESNGSGSIQNRRVGIGTGLPTQRLEVNEANAESILSIRRSGADITANSPIAKLAFKSDYTGSALDYGSITLNSNNIGMARSSMSLNVKSTTGNILSGLTLYGTNNGVNIGIGTTTPAHGLVINQSASDYAIDAGLRRIGNVADPSFGTDAVNKGYVDSAFGALSPLLQGGASSTWAVNGTNIYNVNSGNVGIGTTTPAHKLQVVGVSSTDGNSTITNSNFFAGSTGNFGIYIRQKGTDNGIGGTNWANQIIGNNGNAFEIYSQGGQALILGTNSTERMRVTGSGNVGIGTTTPGAKTHIYNNVADASTALIVNQHNLSSTGRIMDLQFNGNSVAGFDKFGVLLTNAGIRSTNQNLRMTTASTGLEINKISGTGNIALFQYNDATKMVITSDGYVGIGTTGTNSKLTVDVGSSSGENGGFTVSESGSIVASIYDGSAAGGINGMLNLYGGSNRNVRLYAYGDNWINPSNGNFGVGTTTPQAKLHVVGPVGNYTINAGGYRIGNLMNPDLATDAATRSYVDSAFGALSPLLQGGASSTWAVNGTNIYSVNSGNVGIGTTNPGSKLEVNSETSPGVGSSIAQARFWGGGGVNSDYRSGQIVLGRNNNTDASLSWNNADGKFYIDNRFNNDLGDIMFRTKTSGTAINALTIKAVGDIGIGTTAPGAKLQVSGNILASRFTTFSTIATTTALFINDSNGQLAANETLAVIRGYNYSNNNNSNLLIVGTAGGAGSGWEKFVVKNSGNIGIGTTTPLAKLHINGGTGSLSTGLAFGDGDTGVNELIDDILDFKTNSITSFYTSSGSTQSGNSSGWQLTNGAPTSISPTLIPNRTDTDTGIGWAGANILSLIAGGVNVLNVNSSGNVGIGTTTPNARLEVISADNHSILAGLKRIGNVADPSLSTDAANRGYVDSAFGALSPLLQGGASSTWAVNGTNIYNVNSGSVGIGISSPRVNLDVAGANSKIRLAHNVQNAGEVGIEFSHSTYTGSSEVKSAIVTKPTLGYGRADMHFILDSAADSASYVSDATDTKMIIKNDGKIGIGTTNPATKLHIHDSGTSAAIRLSDSTLGETFGGHIRGYGVSGSGGYLTLGTIDGGTNNVAIEIHEQAKEILFKTRSGSSNGVQLERMRIDNSGNVGIGTTGPESILHIAKSVSAAVGPILFLDNPAASTLGNSSDILFSTWANESAVSPGAKISLINTNASSGANAFAFFTKNTSGTVSERVRFDSQGNVGIGTTAPGVPLDVIGDIRTSTRIQLTSSAYISPGRYYAGVNPITFGAWNGSADITRLQIDRLTGNTFLAPNGGNVGIGTTTPEAKLHVVGPVGNYTINAGGYRIGNLMNPDLATDAATRGYVDSAFGAVSPLLQGGASSTWAVNGTNIYNVNSGNVGIGTSNVMGNLHVTNNNGTEDFIVNQEATTNLITNPSFELGTSGWTAYQVSQNRDSSTAYIGSYSNRIDSDNTGSENAQIWWTATPHTTGGTTYAFSLYAKGSGTGIHLDFYDEISSYQQCNITLTSEWKLYTCVKTFHPNSTTRWVGIRGFGFAGEYAYIDAAQLEQKSIPTPYSDGSLGAGYYWTGNPHNSSSVRRSGSIFTYNSLNSANGLGATSNGVSPTLKIDQSGSGDLMTASVLGTARFVINNSGNVGIGTSSPVSPLHIIGRTTNTVSAIGDNIVNYTQGARANASGDSFSSYMYTNTNFSPDFFGRVSWKFEGGTTDSFKQYQIYVANNTVPKLIINGSGNVGIGTTTPNARLEVISADNHSILAGLKRIGNVADPSLSTDAANRGYVDSAFGAVSPLLQGGASSTWAVNGTNIYSVNSGDVGIGTTNPVQKLDVGGTIKSNAAVIGHTALLNTFRTVSGASAASPYAQVLGTEASTSIGIARFVNTEFSGNFYFAKSRGATVGNYAIVQNGDSLGQFIFEGSDGTDFAPAASFGAYVDGTPGNNNMPGKLVFATSLDGTSAPVDRMTIKRDGNVGIGTTSPTYKLDVNAGSSQAVSKFTSSGAGSFSDYQSATGFGRIGFFSQNVLGLAYGSGTTPHLAINSTGNVGIGTTTPAAKLHVVGPVNNYTINAGGYRIGNLMNPDLATDAATRGYVDSGLNAIAPGGASSTWGINGTNIYNVNSGNVGVGTSTPGLDKLRVVGAVSIFGSLNMSGYNITGINKLTVNTIDPLYRINGTNYSTFAPSIVGGVKEEYVGRINIDKKNASGEYEAIIDFRKEKEGTDLWVWRKTVDFSEDKVEVLITPYGKFAQTYFLVDGEKLILRSDRSVSVSYRLIANRLDWYKWPTKALDQDEIPGFIID